MLDDAIPKQDIAMPLSENADTPTRRYADTSSLVAISLVMRNFTNLRRPDMLDDPIPKKMPPCR
jgi:hypothetical protein